MRRNTVLADAGIAAGIALLVLIIAPGLAVVGLLAIFVVLLCGVSFVFDARRAGSRHVRPPRRR